MHHKLNAIVQAMTAGLLGGLVSRYTSPSAVFAQAPKAAPKEIQAQNLELEKASQQLQARLVQTEAQRNALARQDEELKKTLGQAATAFKQSGT